MKRETKEQLEKKKKVTKDAVRDTFLDYMPYIIIIIFVVIIRTFIATPVKVNGPSMSPTLQNGDTMILYKLTKHIRGIKRFDIVVLKSDSGKLIKRVIGLPGDTIKYEIVDNLDGSSKGVLYVNGEETEEEFLSDVAKIKTCTFTNDICSENGFTVPEGEYYVMGDNRGNSKDSRMIGSIKKSDIMGTTNLIIFPFSRIGKAK